MKEIQCRKQDITNLPPEEVYKMVLKGKYIKTFPKGFWHGEDAYEKARICTLFLIHNILNWNDSDIKKNLSTKIFAEHKLGGMLKKVYNHSAYAAINDAMPNKFQPWQLPIVTKDFWKDKNNCRSATLWLINELNLDLEEIPKTLTCEVFARHGLRGLLLNFYNSSPFLAVNDAMPGVFEPWQFNVGNFYWNDKSNRVYAVRSMINKLNWNKDDLKKNISKNTFTSNGLGGLLQSSYNGSVYAAINEAFPNEFQPWELTRVCNNYWDNKNTCRKATLWMIDKLGWDHKDIVEKLDVKTFADNHLIGMLQKAYNSSPFLAIDDAIPGIFNYKDFNIKPSTLLLR